MSPEISMDIARVAYPEVITHQAGLPLLQFNDEQLTIVRALQESIVQGGIKYQPDRLFLQLSKEPGRAVSGQLCRSAIQKNLDGTVSEAHVASVALNIRNTLTKDTGITVYKDSQGNLRLSPVLEKDTWYITSDPIPEWVPEVLEEAYKHIYAVKLNEEGDGLVSPLRSKQQKIINELIKGYPLAPGEVLTYKQIIAMIHPAKEVPVILEDPQVYKSALDTIRQHICKIADRVATVGVDMGITGVRNVGYYLSYMRLTTDSSHG